MTSKIVVNNIEADAGVSTVTFAGDISVTGSAGALSATNLTVNGNAYPNAGTLSNRNKIINGGMDVWQRGTSFTSINNLITYGADRWFAFTTSGTAQARILQNGSVPSGFAYSLALGRQSGNTATSQQFICQCIESANVLGLAGQSVTLSFYAKAGANYSGGSISVILSSGTASDQSSATFSAGPCTGYTGNATVINTTQSINTTWTRYSFTGTVGASALELGLGIGYTPTGTAGADDNIYITGVQLEVGSVATPFEHRNYGDEMARCQRYYQKSYDYGTTPGSSSVYQGAIMHGYTSMPAANYVARFGAQFRTSMRAQPTVVTYDSAGNSGKCNYPDTTTNQSFTLINRGENNFAAETSSLSSSTDARLYFHYTAEAEL